MRMSENEYYKTWNVFIECVDKRKLYGTMYRPEEYKNLKEKLLMEVKMFLEILSYEKKYLMKKDSVYDMEKSKKISEILETQSRLEKLEILLVVSPEDIRVDDFADTYIEKPYHFFLRLFMVICIAFIGWLICTKV